MQISSMICKLKFISHKGVFEIVNNTWHIMYLATHEITKKWTMPLRNWGRVLGELEIMYLNRLTIEETWQITVFIVYCKKIERLFFKPLHNIVFYHCCRIYRDFFAEPRNSGQRSGKSCLIMKSRNYGWKNMVIKLWWEWC